LPPSQREIEKLETYITKFGAKASHAASAQSKKKALEKIDRVELPTELEMSVAKPTFSFPPPPVRFHFSHKKNQNDLNQTKSVMFDI
jgi:ATPase subunit of ABC transporter with duplicated ATPase domains